MPASRRAPVLRPTVLSLALAAALQAGSAWAVEPFVLKDIRVEGLQRSDAGTVFASLPFRIGDTYNDEKGAAALRALFATGLFKDVRIEIEGDVAVVIVDERSIISTVTFVGLKEFDKDPLTKSLKEAGIGHAFVTLHVGGGTFLPVKAEDTKDHVMHSEWGEVSAETAMMINETKKRGGNIIPVGTTSLRLIESAADEAGKVHPFSDETAIFITPGYRFKVADKLLTNFHLPKSTLFMLVSAFSGLERMKQAYRHAIDHQYRFYSYGDACLLEKQ